MRILVTGGAGFMGSALVRELTGHQVLVYDNFSSGRAENLGTCGVVRGDILSVSKLLRTFKEFRPDWVFHLAAEPFIPYSYDNPEKFVETNVIGTTNVLSACEAFDVKKVVHYSTSEVYGNTHDGQPISETNPTLPHSSYGASKLAADRLCFTFHKEHGLPIVIARPFNAYGPRETQPYIIPEIIRQFSKGRTLHLGNLRAQRDFTFVHDSAKGAVTLMEKGIPGEVYNIGSGVAYSVGSLVELLAKRDGYHVVVDESRLRPHDIDVLLCDNRKIRSLGWSPETDIRSGLKETVAWYVENGPWSWE